jgi:hypothetical protein
MQNRSYMRLFYLLACLVLPLIAAIDLSAQSVRVIFVTGQAQIQAPGESSLRPLAKGDIVTLGARIVTGEDGRVALTPLPGVKALITPNTDLLLESVSEVPQSDGKIAAAATLDLKQGSVVTDILKQEGVSYDYNVRTPRGLAGARGTNYAVAVSIAGFETILVAEGAIVFNLFDGRQLSLSAGQVTVTDASGAVRQAATLGELSAADQALAQEVAESTLAALEFALNAGINLNPAAIDQALQVFENLGLDVSESALQPLVRLSAALESLRQETEGADEASTVVTEERQDGEESVVRIPFETFLAGLDPAQSVAFAEFLDRGGFDSTSEDFLARFSSQDFTDALLNTVDLYADLSVAARDQAVALGLLGGANEVVIGADSVGLGRLLESYAAVSSGEVSSYNEASFGAATNTQLPASNVFFNGAEGASGSTIFNVAFGDGDNDSALFVGAARILDLEKNGAYVPSESPTFDVIAGRDIFVRASEQVSLQGGAASPVTFAPDARGIAIDSITINLANVAFHEGSVVILASRDGGVFSSFDPTLKIPNFGASVVGRVNFLGGVRYGENLLDGDEAFVSGTRGNIVIASFADGLSTLFPDYVPVPEDPTPEELFAGTLTPDQLAVFNNLPGVVRLKLVNLNDGDITGLLLAPDRDTGVPLTSTDTQRVLDTFAALPVDARDFVKTLAGGAGLPNKDGTPDIVRWSATSIENAAAVFSGLSPEVRDAIVALGAGDAIVGLNPDYIAGLVSATSGKSTAISEAGWGRYLDEIVADEALSNLDEFTALSTSPQRQFIRLLGLDPYRIADSIRVLDGTTTELLGRIDQILAGVSSEDLQRLSKLGYSDIYSIVLSQDPVLELTAVLTHYDSLTIEQQTAARALRLGSLLKDSLRAASITSFYLGLTLAEQEALRDTDLVTAFYGFPGGEFFRPPEFLDGDAPNPPVMIDDAQVQAAITTALQAYLGLDARVQTYLLAEAQGFDLLAVLISDVEHTDDNGRSLRSLAQISALLTDLAPDDFQTLLDLDLGRAVLFEGYLDPGAPTAADAVRAALAFFRDLPPPSRGTLRELGIIGANQVGFLGSDYTGVRRLLQAYSGLSTAVRIDTTRLDEENDDGRAHAGKVGYFFPSGKDHVLSLVSFSSPSDLHVGAVRRLRIDNPSFSTPPTTFAVQGNHTANIYLRAGDLIDLTRTPIAGNARGILMDAITINLSDVHFPEGTTAALTSRDGGLHFGPGSVVGGVNFLSAVTYGGAPLDNQPNFDANSRGNIAVGSFAAPATLPNYTAPMPQ